MDQFRGPDVGLKGLTVAVESVCVCVYAESWVVS